eukprot:TRINITY_DN2608_c0_g2_i1.p1 TRINITY_DN2608_c0_g2~~TRINITY_DN2608_c0_g2_i1.p1  ORF type:complete len:128 (-),score=24.33 TRINITY_DN2608_c0_g2_i1:91-474(-)
MAADIKIIIGLSALLACGLLLNILSCALYHSAYPILVIVAYFLAPFPNLICAGNADGLTETDSGIKDLGYFLTGFLVVSGFGIPIVLAHAEIIQLAALLMSLAGGLIVYGTILVYLHFFHGKEENPF